LAYYVIPIDLNKGASARLKNNESAAIKRKKSEQQQTQMLLEHS